MTKNDRKNGAGDGEVKKPQNMTAVPSFHHSTAKTQYSGAYWSVDASSSLAQSASYKPACGLADVPSIDLTEHP